MLYTTLLIKIIFTSSWRIKWVLTFQTYLILAWKLLSNKCAKIIDALKQIIASEDFIDRHRFSPKHFTRQRKLPFHLLIFYLINFIKGSYQDELDKFFQAINRFDVAKRLISKAALTKARAKLKFEAFIELNRHLINLFESVFNPITWLGFRLVAIDGTTLQLPRIKEIQAHFGIWNVKKGKACPMARASQLFDPLNKVSLSAIISPKSIGEREQAAQLFLDLLPNDLVLLDRGYPAFWLFQLLLSLDANFCARLSMKWKIAKKFKNSGLNEKIIEIKVPASSTALCKEMGLDITPIKLRLVRVELDSGEIEVLATTLYDNKEYPYELFYDLYHKRWPVEDDYKYIKCWVEMENFTGQSVLSVYQDFYARFFSKNLTSVLSFPARETLSRVGTKVKYEHQINFVQALSKSKNVIPILFQRAKTKVIELVKDLLDIFIRTTEPIRPGRKYPRNHKTFKRKFYMNYKLTC